MKFQELCDKVLAVYDQYALENGIETNADYAILKLVEEVGEFAQAVIIQRGMCRAEKRLPAKKAQANVANELSDILGLTILVADRIGVDLAAGIRDKWLHFLDDRLASPRRPGRASPRRTKPARAQTRKAKARR
jgi:NTP pyrophosphatase (non-canonical NTP hydrolase)